jgi:hypothetical protein
LAASGLDTGELARSSDRLVRTASFAGNRPWVTALVLSCLVHAALLWALASDALRGSSFVVKRSAPIVVQVVPMPTSATALLVNARASTGGGGPRVILQKPDAAVLASKSASKMTVNPGDSDPDASEPLLPSANFKLGGPLPEIRYFSPEELTVKPLLVSDVGSSGPTFIPDILPLPVLVDIMINEQGDVDKVVLGENFLSDVARKYIIDSFATMKFSAGMIAAVPVKSRLRIVVNLDPAMPVN